MKKKAPAKTHKAAGVSYPLVIDSFREWSPYDVGQFNTWKEPTAFNGAVRVRKYRVTIELVDEEVSIIAARIQKLWDECDNHHHWQPIRVAAEKIGYSLVGQAGSRRGS